MQVLAGQCTVHSLFETNITQLYLPSLATFTIFDYSISMTTILIAFFFFFFWVCLNQEERKRALATEREKRAAAAERRIAAAAALNDQGRSSPIVPSTSLPKSGLAGDINCSCCNTSLAGIVPFHRYNYKYCSTSCMHVHREILEDE